jgi:hypothetical protein
MDDVLRVQTPLQRTLRAIAVDALAIGPGETLPTNAHYLAKLDTSVGTIQRAMRLLNAQGALETVSRGHLGRVIRSLEIGRVWNTADLEPVRLLLPPAGAPEIDALVDRLIDTLIEYHIAYTLAHRRGGKKRLNALIQGEADLVLTSAGVRPRASDSFDPEMTHQFGPGSYYGASNLVAITRADRENSMPHERIAIDRESPDHVMLTSTLYPADRGHTFVDYPFPEIPAAILRGQADVGIWHRSELTIPLELCGLQATPLTGSEYERIWHDMSAAVLTGRKDRRELCGLFRILE